MLVPCGILHLAVGKKKVQFAFFVLRKKLSEAKKRTKERGRVGER